LNIRDKKTNGTLINVNFNFIVLEELEKMEFLDIAARCINRRVYSLLLLLLFSISCNGQTTKWMEIDKAFQDYTSNPTHDNFIMVYELLPNSRPRNEVPADKISNSIFSTAIKLEDKIVSESRDAIRLGFKLFTIADGHFAESLDWTLGKLINKNPKLFLQELKNHRQFLHDIGGLVGNYGHDFADKPELSLTETENRIMSLKKIDDSDLINTRDECLKKLQDHKEIILQSMNPREITQIIKGKKLYINDSAQYSQQFFKGLRSDVPYYDSLILIDDTLQVYYTMAYKDRTIHSVHPAGLPTELPLAKEAMYSAEQNGKKYLLTLVRTNFTGINFNLKIDDKTTKTGLLILPVTFFSGDECGSVDENGKYYCSSLYLSDNYDSKSNQDSKVLMKVQLGSGERVLYSEYLPEDWNKKPELILRRQ